MADKPIFLVTHPRSISTAFERIFLARDNDFTCVHEPFSDAYHWGPEKLSRRYENVEALRASKGLENFSYHAAFELIRKTKLNSGKTVFVKDMAKCLLPLDPEDHRIAPSLRSRSAGQRHVAARTHPCFPREANPTVIPLHNLADFRYAFLIRNPRRSVPSLYQCSIPPMSSTTGWNGFKESDIGIKELRRLFDFLRAIGQIGPDTGNKICVIDADDLLAHPQNVVQQFCEQLGIKFAPHALHWDLRKDDERAVALFKNWAPFHAAALSSNCLKASYQENSDEAGVADWTRKYGASAAEQIENSVAANMNDYLHMRQFAIKPQCGTECSCS